MNVMRNIRIEKLTLNIGCGKDQSRLDKAIKLLKNITGINPVKTFTKNSDADSAFIICFISVDYILC